MSEKFPKIPKFAYKLFIIIIVIIRIVCWRGKSAGNFPISLSDRRIARTCKRNLPFLFQFPDKDSVKRSREITAGWERFRPRAAGLTWHRFACWASWCWIPPGGVHEAEWERSVYALVCGSARIARRRSVTHVYKETRVHTDTYIRMRRDEPLPLVLVDQYTMLVEARWEEEAEGHAGGWERERRHC